MTSNDVEQARKVRRERQARYRANNPDLCTRCGGAAETLKKCCAVCQAWWRERYVRGPHDTQEHALWLRRSWEPDSRCAASGASLRELWAIGDRLTVDRIDPTKGYVRGNMQLLSRRLNCSKGKRRAPKPETVALVAAEALT